MVVTRELSAANILYGFDLRQGNQQFRERGSIAVPLKGAHWPDCPRSVREQKEGALFTGGAGSHKKQDEGVLIPRVGQIARPLLATNLRPIGRAERCRLHWLTQPGKNPLKLAYQTHSVSSFPCAVQHLVGGYQQ